MKKPILQLKTPDEVEAVFYEAFMRCDPDVMAGVWAHQDVLCVHPGSGAIMGYKAIVRSWASIFGDSQRTELKHTVITRTVSNDLAVHVIAEEILSSDTVAAVVLATNVYRKFDSGWLMIEHHASLVRNRRDGRTLQ
ncbi:MAG: nuclear transport factor 2 family protein [Gammaproteobacteria bacterium]|jgi:ketosteroid isomerase-like protein